MRFKLDENLPVELAGLLRRSGHDVTTVLDQGVGGARDSELASLCSKEGRVLVTFDTDFTDIRTYPPEASSGIIVLRLGDQSRTHVLETGMRLVAALSDSLTRGELWIVEESRIRIRD